VPVRSDRHPVATCGLEYNAAKTNGHGAKLPSVGQNVPQKWTRDVLAEQYKTSEATIKRDGQFAAAVDKLAEHLGDEAREQVLSRELPDVWPALPVSGAAHFCQKARNHFAISFFSEHCPTGSPVSHRKRNSPTRLAAARPDMLRCTRRQSTRSAATGSHRPHSVHNPQLPVARRVLPTRWAFSFARAVGAVRGPATRP
jgi:hypothetical protein